MAGKTKITSEEIESILQLHKNGNSVRQIEKLTKTCSHQTIFRIINSQTLTPEQIEIKRQKQELTKRIATEKRKAVDQVNEVTSKAIQTIATVQAINDNEQASTSAFNEEYDRNKEQMKKLISLANTNHKNAVSMVSEIMRNVAEKLQSHGRHMNMADNKRAMEVIDLGSDVMSKVFNNLGFDIRNELIQLSMRSNDDKLAPILQWCDSKGNIVDIFQTDYVAKKND